MPRLHLILLPSILVLALPAGAEARLEKAKAAQARPLNLSLPHDVMQAPANRQVDETVERNLNAPAPLRDDSKTLVSPARLPYGAGYEHRHPEMGGAGAAGGTGNGAGANSGGNSGGAGRRGR
jgi:hypothetical protein